MTSRSGKPRPPAEPRPAEQRSAERRLSEAGRRAKLAKLWCQILMPIDVSMRSPFGMPLPAARMIPRIVFEEAYRRRPPKKTSDNLSAKRFVGRS